MKWKKNYFFLFLAARNPDSVKLGPYLHRFRDQRTRVSFQQNFIDICIIIDDHLYDYLTRLRKNKQITN